jgi:hypothetical protein
MPHVPWLKQAGTAWKSREPETEQRAVRVLDGVILQVVLDLLSGDVDRDFAFGAQLPAVASVHLDPQCTHGASSLGSSRDPKLTQLFELPATQLFPPDALHWL